MMAAVCGCAVRSQPAAPATVLPTIPTAAFEEVPTSFQPLIDSLNRLDPLAEATAAAARNDTRLLGIDAMGIRLPGVGDAQYEYGRSLGVRILPFVSDFVTSANGDSTHIQWQSLAFAYAARYNATILAILRNRTH